MKKSSLFTLILVLMMSFSPLSIFADDAEKGSSTQISEESPSESTDLESTEKDEKNSTEKEMPSTEETTPEVTVENIEQTDEEKNTAIQEQDLSKVKKLNAVKSFIKSKNNKLSDAVVTKVAEAALYANEKNQLDLSLILAVMWKESTFNPNVYNTNCYGIMQIHKNTGAGFGYKIKDLKDPYRAADLGSRILKGHIRSYNSLVMGLTAYNQGTGNVNRGNYNTRYANNVIKKQAVIQAYLDNLLKA
ncbi:MAG: transglycosylase SLT domain-containing protein [Peptostreptococcaceae bacterium]|nr:transglycosylase SLT domain-containing protein [Peptostreptococcaceae bacterium]